MDEVRSAGPVRHRFTDGLASHQVTATGTFTEFGGDINDFDTEPEGLVSVDEWGATATTDLSGAFAQARRLDRIAEIPTGVTDMQGMFYFSDFNGPVGAWDTSEVTNMSFMFAGTPFNQAIGSWDVSSVTNMHGMFYVADAFNQPVASWDVSNVTDMAWLFSGASAFNKPIGNWDVSDAANMAYMFYTAASFNQPIGDWDVANVATWDSMFLHSSAFNQDLSAWCVPSIHTFPYRFDEEARAWTQRRPVWGTCGGAGGRDVTPPSATLEFATSDFSRLSVSGRASDDRCVRKVAVGVRSLATGKWLRRDGTWGRFQKLLTELDDRGTWTAWSLGGAHSILGKKLEPGLYGVSVVAADTSGNKNPHPRPWRRVRIY